MVNQKNRNMEAILISTTFNNRITLLFNRIYECSWGQVSISIYKGCNEESVMIVDIQNECQCEHEGVSFYKFNNKDELLLFAKNDDDISTNAELFISDITKIDWL